MIILKFLKTHKLLLLILLVGVFLRSYMYKEYFMYSHDQDLASWVIRDIVENKHLRLVGQETSNHGVFIGALWYYLLIPFYALSNWDPIGGILLPVFISAISIGSIYITFSQIWNKKVGLIGSIFYAVSSYTVFTDREVVPTTPAMLWTIWFLYAVYLIYSGKQKWGFILSAILLGLVWHINLALGLLFPILILAIFLSKKKIDLKSLSLGIAVLFLTLLPFLVFEVRHNFQQVHAILSSFLSTSDVVTSQSKFSQFLRAIVLSSKNIKNLFVGDFLESSSTLYYIAMLSALAYIVFKKVLSYSWGIIFIVWQLLFIFFFSINPIHLSEYYINGMNIIWIAVTSLFVSYLLSKKKMASVGYIFIAVFVVVNIVRVFQVPRNQSGYIERKAIIQEIKADALTHGYSCASISYITDPGYNLGYRDLILVSNLKTKPISEQVPVYSIVFPKSSVDRLDKSFGAIGLIYPDYSRYTNESTEKICEGEDWNKVEPMFGYTQ